MRKYYNNDPRQITVKFDCVCAETGKKLKRGEEAIYYPSSKQVFALDSKQADEYRSWKFDIDVLGANY